MLIAKVLLMKLQIVILFFILISALMVSMVEGFGNHQLYAQTNTSNGNMTSAMVMLALYVINACVLTEALLYNYIYGMTYR